MSKFKVGNKIVLKDDLSGIDTVGICERTINPLKGKTSVVNKIYKSDSKERDLIGIKNSGFIWNAEMFELEVQKTQKSKISKFKIGDRVEVIKEVSGWNIIGQKGTIKDLDACEFDCTVEFDNNIHGHDGNGNCKDGHGLFVSFTDIKLIESEGGKEMKGNFKVKHIGNKYAFTKGKIYEVKNGVLLDDDGINRPIFLNKTFNTFDELQKRFEGDFELVQSAPTITITTDNLKTIATLKEGDTIIETAIAKCNPSDEFKFEIGAKLAVKRLLGEDEPVKVGQPSFDWDGFKQGKFAVHCDTEEKANEFLKKAGEKDIHWGNTRENVAERFIREHSNTCCRFDVYADGLYQGKYDNVIDYQPLKPTCREVNRLAKVGEYVKVVKASNVPETNGKPEYKNGDILKIIYVDCGQATYANGTADNGKNRALYEYEYVVLEGYKPEESAVKEVKRPAKVGEFIKIVDDRHESGLNQNYKLGDVLEVTKTNACSQNDVCVKGQGNFVDYAEYVVLENYNPSNQPSEPKLDITTFTNSELFTELNRRLSNER